MSKISRCYASYLPSLLTVLVLFLVPFFLFRFPFGGREVPTASFVFCLFIYFKFQNCERELQIEKEVLLIS